MAYGNQAPSQLQGGKNFAHQEGFDFGGTPVDEAEASNLLDDETRERLQAEHASGNGECGAVHGFCLHLSTCCAMPYGVQSGNLSSGKSHRIYASVSKYSAEALLVVPVRFATDAPCRQQAYSQRFDVERSSPLEQLPQKAPNLFAHTRASNGNAGRLAAAPTPAEDYVDWGGGEADVGEGSHQQGDSSQRGVRFSRNVTSPSAPNTSQQYHPSNQSSPLGQTDQQRRTFQSPLDSAASWDQQEQYGRRHQIAQSMAQPTRYASAGSTAMGDGGQRVRAATYTPAQAAGQRTASTLAPSPRSPVTRASQDLMSMRSLDNVVQRPRPQDSAQGSYPFSAGRSDSPDREVSIQQIVPERTSSLPQQQPATVPVRYTADSFDGDEASSGQPAAVSRQSNAQQRSSALNSRVHFLPLAVLPDVDMYQAGHISCCIVVQLCSTTLQLWKACCLRRWF